MQLFPQPKLFFVKTFFSPKSFRRRGSNWDISRDQFSFSFLQCQFQLINYQLTNILKYILKFQFQFQFQFQLINNQLTNRNFCKRLS
jgi:hypothetical protein